MFQLRCKVQAIYIDIYLHLTPDFRLFNFAIRLHYPIRKFAKNEDTVNAINKLKGLNIENFQSLPNDKLCIVINFVENWILG